MPDTPRFGPAGIPYWFKELKKPTSQLPHLLKQEGLNALEYEAVRWGRKPQIRQEEAERLRINAEKSDVWLTIHGSYYINLLGDKEIVEASMKRLIAAATAAKWMNAHTIVFHPGYYSQKHSHRKDLQNCIQVLTKVTETIQSMGVEAQLGPEVSGKLAQLGSLEEVIAICESVEQTQPVVDWAHLHARRRGSLRAPQDFEHIVEEIEKRLGSQAAKNLHCHFSLIEYTFRGERRHHPFGTPGYGPKFKALAETIANLNLTPVIICETPLLDADAKKMRDIVYEKLNLHVAQR